MLYILDQYGNKTELNPTFKMVGLPYKREYSTTKIPGLEGELQTTEPVLSSANRSIRGTLYGITKEEVRSKRDELADVCGRGLIKVGHEEEGWYVEGQCISFDHKYTSKPGRRIAEVSITIKCDDPHQKADEVIEELIITPSDYPERIDMSNPHPAANVKLGTFDPTTGVKISDENSWEGYSWYISSLQIGNGFSFLSFTDYTLMMFQDTVSRKMKIFADGELIKEVELAGDTGFAPIEVKFDTKKAREITVVQTEGNMSIDCIIPIPANLPVLKNPGTVADYPVLEVESADTEAIFSPLGKTLGDADHPLAIWRGAGASLPVIATATASANEVTQDRYNRASFLDDSTIVTFSITAGNHIWVTLGCNLKALQSAYASMTVDEIKNNMQSILSEIWSYAEGAIEVGDPSFESGVNGFAASTGVAISQSSDWAKTGTKSLKIISDGTQQYAYAIKSYGNQAGKKLKASLWIRNNESTPADIRVNWLDITSGISAAAVYETIPAQTEIEITLPEYIAPADSQEIRLIIYPAFGVAGPATIYIDDTTVASYGVELYVRNHTTGEWKTFDNPAWKHELDYPELMSTLIHLGSVTQFEDIIGVDGKIYFLVRAKYPSDGITRTTIVLDHCRLNTKMNYAKLGADAITNYGGNLLPPFTDPAWTIHANARVIGEYEIEHRKTSSQEEYTRIWIDGLPNTTYYFSGDGIYRISEFTSDSQLIRTSNSPEELKTKENTAKLVIDAYVYPHQTGTLVFNNPMLAISDSQQHFKPQDLRLLEFSEDIVLSKGDIITADTKRREIIKNGESLYQLINQSFKFFPLMIFGGQNHFRINHSGANLKIRMKYQPKWR